MPQKAFEFPYSPLGGFAREAEAILVCRPRPDIPELGDVLVRVEERGIVPEEPFEPAIHDAVIGVIAPRNPQQDVRIDQVRITHLTLYSTQAAIRRKDARGSALIVIVIDHAAGEVFAWHRGNLV